MVLDMDDSFDFLTMLCEIVCSAGVCVCDLKAIPMMFFCFVFCLSGIVNVITIVLIVALAMREKAYGIPSDWEVGEADGLVEGDR